MANAAITYHSLCRTLVNAGSFCVSLDDAALVTRGQIINFTVGPAAFYFGAAVFLTMISTSQFDSRLIWKIYDRKQ